MLYHRQQKYSKSIDIARCLAYGDGFWDRGACGTKYMLYADGTMENPTSLKKREREKAIGGGPLSLEKYRRELKT